MDTNDFDVLLRKKFDQEELPFKAEAWEKMAAQLSVQKATRPRLIPIWKIASGVAASVAIAVVSVLLFRQSEQKAYVRTGETAAKAANTTVTANVAAPAPAAPSAAIAKTVNTAAVASVAHITRAHAIVQYRQAAMQAAATPAQQPAATGEHLPVFAESSEQKQITAEEVIVAKPQEKTKSANSSLLLSNGRITDWENEFSITDEQSASRAKSSFGLTGGVNYGSQNSGYMVGVNARRSLGERLFLEGAVALVNNNQMRNVSSTGTTLSTDNSPAAITTSNAAPPASIKPSGAASMQVQNETQASSTSKGSVSTTTSTRKDNLYYLQVMPTVGYYLNKKISLGVGADVQRLLQDNEELNKEVATDKRLPATDLGMVGRIEYAVTPTVKAGLSYREGMNGLIDNGQYMSRRYVQLQFSWSLSGNR